MIATQQKTRARANHAALPVSQAKEMPVTIEDIRMWISMAEEKLELAYDVADPGQPLGTLLHHVTHDVIVSPHWIIQRKDLTQADAIQVYEGLFPVLACIQGAIKLSEKTALGGTLVEAFKLLDSAQNALDSVNDAVRALPVGGVEHSFARGREMAIAALKDIADDPSAHECYRKHRSGAQQQDSISDHVIDMMGDQTLLAGFSAVIVGALASGCSADYFEGLKLAETRAGKPGEDDTQTLDSKEASKTTSASNHLANIDAFDQAANTAAFAIAIMQSRLPNMNKGADLAYGARMVAQKAVAMIAEAREGSWNVADFELASAPLGVAAAVLQASIEVQQDSVLSGAHRLLVDAKTELDNAITEAM